MSSALVQGLPQYDSLPECHNTFELHAYCLSADLALFQLINAITHCYAVSNVSVHFQNAMSYKHLHIALLSSMTGQAE